MARIIRYDRSLVARRRPSRRARPPRRVRPIRRGRALARAEPYQQLFDRNPQPMWVVALETFRFLAVNDAALERYGYSRDEFLAMTILDIRPAEDIPAVLRTLEIPRSRSDIHGTWRHRMKSGELIDVELHWNSVMFRGRRAHLVLALDMTPRRKVEHELKKLRDQLEQRVAERTAALEAVNRELEAEIQERVRLSNQLVHVQEAERRRLARELHDEVGQTLTGLKLTLQAIPRLDGGEAREKLGWAESIVDTLMKVIRELSLNLRPSMLDDLGLLPALLWLIDRYTVGTGIHVAFTHVGIDGRLATEVESAAFRIVQEALTNVARHAGVEEVRLWVRRDPRELSVIVEDDGQGIPRERLTVISSGLSGMRERAELVGGQLLIETSAAGTRVTAIVPLEDVDAVR
jgi:PAS domain S-box-containing protein